VIHFSIPFARCKQAQVNNKLKKPKKLLNKRNALLSGAVALALMTPAFGGAGNASVTASHERISNGQCVCHGTGNRNRATRNRASPCYRAEKAGCSPHRHYSAAGGSTGIECIKRS
jgi:hypothetical protein